MSVLDTLGNIVGNVGQWFTQIGTGAVARTVNSKLADVVSVKDFGAKGDGVTDDTAAIQAAINVIQNTGGMLEFTTGHYLCGSLTWNTSNGGVLYAKPGTVFLLPNANNVTFFTITNSTIGKPATIDGISFDNTALKTSISGISIDKYYMFSVRNITALHLQYIIAASATTQNSYNLSVDNVLQFGTGSIHIVATAPNYCFATRISNVSQFTGGGDTWSDAWFVFQRCVNLVADNLDANALSGTGVGMHCIGDCQGIFISNSVIVQPTYGLITDKSNGDAAVPSYLYFQNFAIDQPTITGASILARAVKMTNSNITFGSDQNNTGVGLQLVTGSSDLTFDSLRVESMYNDGVQIQASIPDVRFVNCFLSTNAVSGAGFDIDMVSLTPRNPTFRDCDIGTTNLNSSVYAINGGSTSRYVYSLRSSVLSTANATNQVLATVTLPSNTLVNGKTLRISTSGIYAANTNSKSIAITVGGVNIAAMGGTFNGVAFIQYGEIFRIDANNVVCVGDSRAGSTTNVTSVIQTPFDSVDGLTINLLGTGVANSDIIMHHFDVELID